MVPIPFFLSPKGNKKSSENLMSYDMLEAPGELEETQGTQEALGSFHAI